MSSSKWLLLLILLLVAGCSDQPIAPTPTAAIGEGAEETATPNVTLAPATATSLPTGTTSRPTETVGATATSFPPTPTLEATPSVSLTVTVPEADATIESGSEVRVSGEVSPGVDAVTVSLLAAGLTLVENSVPLQDTGTSWETVLSVPETVAGRARLRVTAADETINRPVLLRRSSTSGPDIELIHPGVDSTAVSGQVLFFTGEVQQPLDGAITISVLYEECQMVGARQTFEVGQGGQWWGFVLIPDTVFGPGCAVAYTGGFMEEGWRASTTPLTILQADDPAARGIFLGNFAREVIVPGEMVTVYGSAYNTNEVHVHLQVGNRTVAEGTAAVTPFGYWEIDLTLPTDVPAGSEGFFVVSTTYDGEVVEERTPFLIITR